MAKDLQLIALIFNNTGILTLPLTEDVSASDDISNGGDHRSWK
jgi:hypothetical protein